MFFCAALLCAFARVAPSQEVAPEADAAAPANPVPAAPISPTVSGDNAADDHRMFKIVPNYKTVNDPEQPFSPIDAGEKFALVQHYFDPFTFVFTSITAGHRAGDRRKSRLRARRHGLRQAVWRRFYRRLHQ